MDMNVKQRQAEIDRLTRAQLNAWRRIVQDTRHGLRPERSDAEKVERYGREILYLENIPQVRTRVKELAEAMTL